MALTLYCSLRQHTASCNAAFPYFTGDGRVVTPRTGIPAAPSIAHLLSRPTPCSQTQMLPGQPLQSGQQAYEGQSPVGEGDLGGRWGRVGWERGNINERCQPQLHVCRVLMHSSACKAIHQMHSSAAHVVPSGASTQSNPIKHTFWPPMPCPMMTTGGLAPPTPLGMYSQASHVSPLQGNSSVRRVYESVSSGCVFAVCRLVRSSGPTTTSGPCSVGTSASTATATAATSAAGARPHTPDSGHPICWLALLLLLSLLLLAGPTGVVPGLVAASRQQWMGG